MYILLMDFLHLLQLYCIESPDIQSQPFFPFYLSQKPPDFTCHTFAVIFCYKLGGSPQCCWCNTGDSLCRAHQGALLRMPLLKSLHDKPLQAPCTVLFKSKSMTQKNSKDANKPQMKTVQFRGALPLLAGFCQF